MSDQSDTPWPPQLPDPQSKRPISLRLDEDVFEFFYATGKGYQTRINAVLRSYVDHHRKAQP